MLWYGFAWNLEEYVQADCLEEEEILQRKAELERLQNDGLRVYSFPEDVVSRLTDAAHGLSRSDSSADELVSSPPSAPTFKPPFNIVAGTHADLTVHRFWFVRKYRCVLDSATCSFGKV